MFTYRKVYPFTWPVQIAEGVVGTSEFRGRFVSLPQSQIDEINAAYPAEPDRHIAAAAFQGWVEGDVVDVTGAPVPVTAEAIAGMIEQPFIRLAIVRAFFAAMNGLLAKN